MGGYDIRGTADACRHVHDACPPSYEEADHISGNVPGLHRQEQHRTDSVCLHTKNWILRFMTIFVDWEGLREEVISSLAMPTAASN